MIRRLILGAALALLSLAASAQSLTTAQLQTLKTYINTVPAWSALPNNSDNAVIIAAGLNATAVPAYIVWRNDVKAAEIGDAWVGTDIDGMSALNMQRLQLLLASSPAGIFDMGRADRRAGFENPFGASTNNPSRVAMRAVWKRSARVVEQVFATGSGTDASPSVMGFVGAVSWPDVQTARGL